MEPIITWIWPWGNLAESISVWDESKLKRKTFECYKRQDSSWQMWKPRARRMPKVFKIISEELQEAGNMWPGHAAAPWDPPQTSLWNGAPNANLGLAPGTELLKMMRYTFQSRCIKGIVQRININNSVNMTQVKKDNIAWTSEVSSLSWEVTNILMLLMVISLLLIFLF